MDSNHIPSCTSAVSVLQLCKVSQNSNKPFRRSCAYKVHGPPFRKSISWIISPFKFWTATIFLHAHLQVVYYKCAKFHKNPISRLGGVALTRYMDGWTGWFLYTPQTLFAGGIKRNFDIWCWNQGPSLWTDTMFIVTFSNFSSVSRKNLLGEERVDSYKELVKLALGRVGVLKL